MDTSVRVKLASPVLYAKQVCSQCGTVMVVLIIFEGFFSGHFAQHLAQRIQCSTSNYVYGIVIGFELSGAAS